MNLLKDINKQSLALLPKNSFLNEWNILLSYRGSIAHNTFIKNHIDDIDLIGIYIPPIDYYFGTKDFEARKGTVEFKYDKIDIVAYEFTKIIRLLAGCNPNIINILWTKPQFFINITPQAQLLIDNKHLFICKKVFFTFAKYAENQIIQMHKNSKKGYMGQKREQLVKKFGYDTKNAAHAIRLLKMCYEILQNGVVNVYREDCDLLLDIKTGKWSLEKVKNETEKLFSICQKAYENSTLNENVDMNKINDLSVLIMKKHFNIN